MKIGVIGVPGSGKSAFAKSLAKQLGDACVVDNYVQRVQRDTGLALGPWAPHHENLMVAGVREAARAKKSDAKYHITVGTIMDTMAYVMAYGDIGIHHNDPVRAQQVYVDTRAVVNGLALWYNTTWDYDVCFFLPLREEPKPNDILGTFYYQLGEAYPTVLETFFATVFGLEGKTKERVQIAREVIEILERDKAARADQEDESAEGEERSVRPGVEDGEGVGDPSEPMPDLSLED